jgi:hypothetical protein
MEVQKVAKAGVILDDEDAELLMISHFPVFPCQSVYR